MKKRMRANCGYCACGSKAYRHSTCSGWVCERCHALEVEYKGQHLAQHTVTEIDRPEWEDGEMRIIKVQVAAGFRRFAERRGWVRRPWNDG